MDNDVLHILRVLYERREVNAYQLHAATMIPPTTIYVTLESERKSGHVERDGIIYRLTQEGEIALSAKLGKELLKPSMTFKEVPEKYIGTKVSKDAAGVLSIIVQ